MEIYKLNLLSNSFQGQFVHQVYLVRVYTVLLLQKVRNYHRIGT